MTKKGELSSKKKRVSGDPAKDTSKAKRSSSCWGTSLSGNARLLVGEEKKAVMEKKERPFPKAKEKPSRKSVEKKKRCESGGSRSRTFRKIE